MKRIAFKKKELNYMEYVFRAGFVIDPNCSDREYKTELKTVQGIYDKLCEALQLKPTKI